MNIREGIGWGSSKKKIDGVKVTPNSELSS